MAKSDDLMVGVDLGGTSMMLVALNSSGKIVTDRKRSTRPDLGPNGVTKRIAQTVDKLLGDLGKDARRVRGVCVGAPGAVDPRNGIVHHAPNLRWKNYPLAEKLADVVGLPVTVDNDVNAGAVGEHVLGAARGSRNLVAIFVGTGIGGGIILDGKLHHGSRGSAGEIGHMKILAEGPVCGCGRRGCAEALASRTAMERDVRNALRAGRKSVIPKIMKRDRRERMTSSVIQEALAEKDPLMEEIFRKSQVYLGILVASVVNLLDPECVVIGGGIVERLGEKFLRPIRLSAYQHFLKTEDAERIRIVASELQDHAGSAGAAVLAWKRLAKVTVKGGRFRS